MATKYHIVVLCSRIDLPGGIERAVVNTANLFAQHGNRISLIILDETNQSFYPVDPSVEIIQKQLSFGITNDGNVISRKLTMLSDVLQLRKLIRQLDPQIIIASEYPFMVASVLAGIKKKRKIFSWEHHHFNWLKKNNFWKTLCQFAYPKLDSVICLNQDEVAFYNKYAKVAVIPNFIMNTKGVFASMDSPQILTIGRLIPRKGIDMLLTISEKVLSKNPGWIWKVIGEGEMSLTASSFIKEKGLENSLIIVPPTGHDLTEEYCNSSMYVMTSRFEAFPMVLLEAQSLGLPCISFDCPSGPSSIIRHDINGLLIQNGKIEDMADAIDKMIQDIELRKKLSQGAKDTISEFSPEKVYLQWTELFKAS